MSSIKDKIKALENVTDLDDYMRWKQGVKVTDEEINQLILEELGRRLKGKPIEQLFHLKHPEPKYIVLLSPGVPLNEPSEIYGPCTKQKVIDYLMDLDFLSLAQYGNEPRAFILKRTGLLLDHIINYYNSNWNPYDINTTATSIPIFADTIQKVSPNETVKYIVYKLPPSY